MNQSEDDRTVEELRRTFDEAAGRAPVTLDRPFVLVPLSFVVVHSEATVPTVASSGRAAIESAQPGWRWEMWSNVQMQVPETWDRSQNVYEACGIEDEITGFVSRPDGPGNMEICQNWAQAPTRVPNLAFLAGPGTPKPGTRTYPNGTVTIKKIGSTKVMVVAKSDALRRRILGSADVVTDTNAAGCPVGARIPVFAHAPSTGPSVADVRNVDLVSVCRYHPGSVAYAFTLSGAKAAAVVDALRHASAGVGPNDPKNCSPGLPENEVGLYRLWSGRIATDVWVHWDRCTGHGIDDGTGTRRLTADVLAPFIGVAWGGSISANIPVPESSTVPGLAIPYVP